MMRDCTDSMYCCNLFIFINVSVVPVDFVFKLFDSVNQLLIIVLSIVSNFCILI